MKINLIAKMRNFILVNFILFFVSFKSLAQSPITQTFNFTGVLQTFTVPACVSSLTISAYGSQGGTNSNSTTAGGLGGSTIGVLTVTAGQVLNIYVGGLNGFNGGGAGGVTSGSPLSGGGIGGGASDVRVGGIALLNRVIVAGAGGGGGGNRIVGYGRGAGGGGGSGYYGGGGGAGWPGSVAGGTVASGGTQLNGGTGGTSTYNIVNNGIAGSLGLGGGGGAETGSGQGSPSQNSFVGGNGGGLSGSNGIHNFAASYWVGQSGAGGSSFLGILTATSSIAGVRSGNGQVLITYGFNGNGVNLSASNQTICAGTTVSLVASGVNSYTWSTGSNASFINVTPATTTNYTVNGTNSLGCISNSIVTISVNSSVPSLTVVNSATSAICPGRTVTITASGAPSFTFTGGITNGVPFIPLTNSSYTVFASNVCGTSSISTSVSVSINPTISAIASTASLCSGATATLIGSGASTYTWSNGVTNGISFSPLITNIYTLTASSALGCTATAVVGITVVNTPNQMPLPSPPSLCNGNSSTLTASGATNYTWQPGNFNTASIVVTPTSTSVWTCTMANGNCVSTQSVSVIVNQLPNVVTLVTPTIVCAGKSASITAGGALTYTWTQGTYTLIGANIVVTPTANTVFTITASNGTCIAQPTFTMLTLPSPTLIVTPSSSVICFGQTASLTVSGAVSYTWNAPVNLNTASISVSPTAPISYSVSGTNSVGCISGKTQVVLVNPNPILTTGTTPSFVCIGGASTATVTGANTYSWNTGSTSSITAINPTTTTIYTVTGTNSNTGCKTTETVMVVTFQPTLVVTTATSVCIGTSVTLNASGAVSYTWNTGVVGSGNNSTISVGPSVYTTYSVTATTSSMVAGYVLNCLASNTIGVTVNQNPTITATCIRTLICRGETTSLTANGAFTYNWLAPLQTTGSIVAVSPYSTTNYTMIGTDANGCKDTTSIQIKVSACVGVGELNNLSELIKVYPNPNNGEFEITSKGIDIELKIINDLGQLVKIINLNKINNYEIKVNELSNGVYFVVGQNKTTNINQKIIINK